MSEIVISGYYGFGNAGDEAMLTAMIEALTDVNPAVRITVISGCPADTRRRHGVASVFRLNYPEIIRILRKSDLLISGGGSLLQDVTSDRSLYYYLSIMMLAEKLGKPVMLYAQGIGPVRGAMAKGAMRHIGNMVDLITVRDEGSRTELKSLGVDVPPIHVTADPVLALHQVDKGIGRAILKKRDLEGNAPLIGISVREWKDWTYYKTTLAEAADRLVAECGARLVFLPMQWPDDMNIARRIADRMKQPAAVLEEEYTTSELLSLVGNLDMLIGIRLHALIFAAVMHVPLIGISYDPKIDRFLETVGDKPVGTLQNFTADALLAKVRALWPEIRHPSRERAARIGELRQKAFRNAELAMALIENRKRG
ncbi:polysaccharide pyruvyl transferase CsaB [Anaeroselena agilis]|uniref:Polysaccharide pyruvyl transferase CsaB n=1 Tax=Anaeroselena agilis TaxID=3063788 RepID=A0ABU3P5Y6_9FIRM|nr:polysaccharide pyruvyl transferase CsaB [Selenomonadales bacterium 4137-cl]